MNLGIEGSLSEHMYTFQHLQQEYVYRKIKQLGLNEYQARSLSFIRANEGTMQKDLAKYLGKSDATLTNILKQLETKGYILRKVPLDNERLKQLYLTEAGKIIAEEIHEVFVELEERLTAAMNKTDRIKMLKFIKQLNESLYEVEE